MAAAALSPNIKGLNDGAKSIWDKVLEGASKAELPPSQIVVFGRRDCGKSTIVRAMQRMGAGGERKTNDEEFFRDSAGVGLLQYAYIDARLSAGEFDHDRASACSTVMVFQELNVKAIKALLLPRLKQELLGTTVFVIVLSLAEPWSLRIELGEWLTIISEVLTDVLRSLTPQHQKELRDNQRQRLADVNGGESPGLEANFGIPIVVAVAKSDTVVALNSISTQGQADVVLAHLRDLCLPYGATLVYCYSSPDHKSKNLEVLYSYLLHLLYNSPFSSCRTLEEPDSIFIPGGSDTRESIDEFASQTIAGGLTKAYETIVLKPHSLVESGQWDLAGGQALGKVVEIGPLNSFLEDFLKNKQPARRVEEAALPRRASVVRQPTSTESRASAKVEVAEFFRTLVKPSAEKQGSRSVSMRPIEQGPSTVVEDKTTEQPAIVGAYVAPGNVMDADVANVQAADMGAVDVASRDTMALDEGLDTAKTLVSEEATSPVEMADQSPGASPISSARAPGTPSMEEKMLKSQKTRETSREREERKEKKEKKEKREKEEKDDKKRDEKKERKEKREKDDDKKKERREKRDKEHELKKSRSIPKEGEELKSSRTMPKDGEGLSRSQSFQKEGEEFKKSRSTPKGEEPKKSRSTPKEGEESKKSRGGPKEGEESSKSRSTPKEGEEPKKSRSIPKEGEELKSSRTMPKEEDLQTSLLHKPPGEEGDA